MSISRERALVVRQVRQESKSSSAIGCDPVAVDGHCAPHELGEVIPVQLAAVAELPHQPLRVKRIARLPELEHDQPTDERWVKRPDRKHAQIINVAGLAALIAGANLLGNDFREREAGNGGGCEGKVLKVALLSCPRCSVGNVGVSRRLIWILISLAPAFQS